jgi:large repetitive protein
VLLFLLLASCGGPSATTSPTASPSATKSATPSSARGVWLSAGTMKTARDYHTATLLRNGKVLVAGGYSGPLGTVVLVSTELYDPATNRWSEAAPMLIPHASHTAALLPDGKVLVASGRSSGGDTVEAETYDPANDVWSKAGNLAVARTSATAIVLTTGRVLVLGGDGTTNPGAELYDPGTNSWSQLPNTTTHHVNVASSLSNGRVLVLGDLSNWAYQFSAQYDPVSNTWFPIGRPAISFASAVLLRNGKVLFVRKFEPGDDRLARLYDPVSDNWTPAAPMEINGVWGTATALPGGRALVAGSPMSGGILGCRPGASCPNAEVYDAAKDAWTVTSGMATSRGEHTATLLANGKVLITGGYVPPDPDMTATTEIYDPTGQ